MPINRHLTVSQTDGQMWHLDYSELDHLLTELQNLDGSQVYKFIEFKHPSGAMIVFDITEVNGFGEVTEEAIDWDRQRNKFCDDGDNL